MARRPEQDGRGPRVPQLGVQLRTLAEGGGAGQAHVQREECVSLETYSKKEKKRKPNQEKGRAHHLALRQGSGAPSHWLWSRPGPRAMGFSKCNKIHCFAG